MTCRYENIGKANTSHLAHRASCQEMFISFFESLKSRLCTQDDLTERLEGAGSEGRYPDTVARQRIKAGQTFLP